MKGPRKRVPHIVSRLLIVLFVSLFNRTQFACGCLNLLWTSMKLLKIHILVTLECSLNDLEELRRVHVVLAWVTIRTFFADLRFLLATLLIPLFLHDRGLPSANHNSQLLRVEEVPPIEREIFLHSPVGYMLLCRGHGGCVAPSQLVIAELIY